MGQSGNIVDINPLGSFKKRIRTRSILQPKERTNMTKDIIPSMIAGMKTIGVGLFLIANLNRNSFFLRDGFRSNLIFFRLGLLGKIFFQKLRKRWFRTPLVSFVFLRVIIIPPLIRFFENKLRIWLCISKLPNHSRQINRHRSRNRNFVKTMVAITAFLSSLTQFFFELLFDFRGGERGSEDNRFRRFNNRTFGGFQNSDF